MAGTTDSGSSTVRERAGSLTIRRSPEGYHFELDVPSSGGSLRPTIWSGSQIVDVDTFSLLHRALESATAGLSRPALNNAPVGVTMVASSAVGQLEQLGKLIYRYILPDEVQDELARYIGPLLLATDDASLPWELIHDGRDFLALKHAVGRRLVVSGRRRRDDGPDVASGALLIGGATNDPEEQQREIETVERLLAPTSACTVLRGGDATKAAIMGSLLDSPFNIIHFVGHVLLGNGADTRRGLLLSDDQLLQVTELERALQGAPFIFINGSGPTAGASQYIGDQTAALASTLAGARMRALVGPLWPVHGAGSRLLAAEFYRLATDGVPAGEALRRARLAVRARVGDELAWSAYVLCGDPGLLILPDARPAAVQLMPEARFASVILRELVGRGGMGVVWRAYQPALDRDVAVKLLPVAGHQPDEMGRDRFQREARIIGRLRHPNIIQVHDYGEEQGFLYLITDFMSGGTLQDLLRREGALSVERAVTLMLPVADALDHLHQHGIIHRDVKPSNILMSGDSRPVLADVGIARLVDDNQQMTRTGVLVGTPAYISPEQVAGKDAEAASDQYALGIVLFEALTGRVPFAGTTVVETAMAHMSKPPPSPRSINPSLTEETEAVLLRALEKDPANRYASCTALIEALRDSIDDKIGAVSGRSLLPLVSGNGVDAYGVQVPTRVIPGETQSGTARPTNVEIPTMPDTAQPLPHSRGTQRWLWVVVLAAWGTVLAVAISVGLIPTSALQGLLPGVTLTEVAVAPTAASAAATSPPTVVQFTATIPGVVPTSVTTVAVPTVAPSSTPVPPTPIRASLTEWNEVISRLDSGLWARDLPGGANLLEGYVNKFQQENPPELALAREKLYSANIELGQRAVATLNFGAARLHFERAAALKPNDLLAGGELKKVNLWLAGDEAYRRGDWDGAIENFGELARIDASFGNASQKLEASQAELSKTWTPTPEPVIPQPVYQQQPAAPQPVYQQQPAAPRAPYAPAPQPAAAPTKSPLAPR